MAAWRTPGGCCYRCLGRYGSGRRVRPLQTSPFLGDDDGTSVEHHDLELAHYDDHSARTSRARLPPHWRYTAQG
jgi:hypothetical protein